MRATVAQADSRGAARAIGLYHGGDEERRVRRLSILGDLRRAVRHEELQLFYQPKITLADGQVCGAEALVRWDHPRLGRLSPAEFIPIAEQSGNISILTRWALTTAARECRLWLEEGLDVPVSVNLSAHDLLDKDLPWFVLDLLRNHDLAPRYLVAEITEEGLVRDFANATIVLQRLRDLGIRISIDDFGTGYSSLAQIRNLPVDELKIDKSFVTQLPDNRADAAIVGAAIDLAHNLGLRVRRRRRRDAPGAALAARARLRARAGLLHQQAAAVRRVHRVGTKLRWWRDDARAGPAGWLTRSMGRMRLSFM